MKRMPHFLSLAEKQRLQRGDLTDKEFAEMNVLKLTIEQYVQAKLLGMEPRVYKNLSIVDNVADYKRLLEEGKL